MAGLLDFEDPNTAGAMQLGLGLLNAGGPSRMPVSLGQGIAQGEAERVVHRIFWNT